MTQASPRYRQVADTLRRRIRNGVYRPGDAIETTSTLERRFKVSNITIRRALTTLADEGWVIGKRGVGTIVTEGPCEEKVGIAVTGNFREWVETAGARRLPIDQEVLGFAVEPAPPRVLRIFGRTGGSALWTMRRVRAHKGRVISYHVNFGLPERLDRITRQTMAGNRNFVDVLRRDLGIRLAAMEQTVEATVADCDLAERLEADFGDPLFFVENAYRGVDGSVVAVTHLYLRGDRYVYRADLRLTDAEGSGATG